MKPFIITDRYYIRPNTYKIHSYHPAPHWKLNLFKYNDSFIRVVSGTLCIAEAIDGYVNGERFGIKFLTLPEAERFINNLK